MKTVDAIAAIATPSGRGGVGIVRISGDNAKFIAEKITHQKNMQPRVAYFSQFFDAQHEMIDEGILLYFENPNSFTGEDVVELQGHGGPVVLNKLLHAALNAGARMARAGEFSERAFLNHKIDLVQAEAIADLIAADSDAAAKSAMRSLQGVFSEKIAVLQHALTHLRVHVEATLDFPEEEIDFINDPAIAQQLNHIIETLNQIKKQATQGALLQQGLTIAIVGEPNVGKSSLLNYFSGRESAIVTDIPGTTRDVLRESITLDGLPLHLVDTAGLRETNDVVEQEGVRRAKTQMQQADLILWMMDAVRSDQKPSASVGAKARTIIIKNKIDLTQESPRIEMQNNIPTIFISLKEKKGLDLLTNEIKKIAGYQLSVETDGFIARKRHVDALMRAENALLHGQTQLQSHRATELLAEDLRAAQTALSEITGEFTSDDLLGKIFSSFCIGK